jgi:hypothetical protein
MKNECRQTSMATERLIRKMKPPAPAKLLERDIQRQIRDFLTWRCWRIIRHQVAVATSGASTFSTGEKGMADLQAIYYFTGTAMGHTLTLWIETKRLGKPLRPEQIAWREKEEARGAVVWKADSLDYFMEAYERDFGWLHTRDGVKGQKMMEFEAMSNLPSKCVESVSK